MFVGFEIGFGQACSYNWRLPGYLPVAFPDLPLPGRRAFNIVAFGGCLGASNLCSSSPSSLRSQSCHAMVHWPRRHWQQLLSIAISMARPSRWPRRGETMCSIAPRTRTSVVLHWLHSFTLDGQVPRIQVDNRTCQAPMGVKVRLHLNPWHETCQGHSCQVRLTLAIHLGTHDQQLASGSQSGHHAEL